MRHLSVEQFVTEAVRLHLEEAARDAAIQEMFTSARIARIAAAKAQVDAGHGLSLDESKTDFEAKRAEFLRDNS